MHQGRITLLAITMLIPFSVFSATYYVDPDGGADGNAGTESSPWKTIARANSTLMPGDTVILRDGLYVGDHIQPVSSGRAGEPIEYRAFAGEQAVITNVDTAIILNKRSYIVIDGIVIDGQANGQKARGNANVDHFANLGGASFITIQNSTMRDAHGWSGIHISGDAHHNRIINNVIDNVGTNDDGIEDHGDSLVIKCAEHNLVEGNLFTRGGHNLFDVMGLSNVLRNNTFDNRWDDSGGARIGDINTNEQFGCDPAHTRGNTLFEGNIVRNANATGDNPTPDALKVQGNRNIVRRNFFVNNIANVFQSALRPPEHYETRLNRIFNNTLYGNGSLWTARAYNQTELPAEDNEFKNNIVAETRDEQVVYLDWLSRADAIGGNPINDARFISNAFQGVDTVRFRVIGIGSETMNWYESHYPENFSGNILADPSFVSSNPKSREDFALSPSSAMVDAGEDLTRVRGSGSGTTLPVEDAGYFFGRIEFGIYAGDEIMLGNGATAHVLSVDYERSELTLSNSLNWTQGDSVNLLFGGAGPDIGAVESGLSGNIRRPRAPLGLTVTR